MKKKDYRNILSQYSLRGFAFGLILAVLIILLSLDAGPVKQTGEGLWSLLYLVPGMWIVVFFPFIFAFLGYQVSSVFVRALRKQHKRIKKEASKTRMVLGFIDNLRQGKLDEIIPNNRKHDALTNALIKLREFMIQSKKEQEQRRLEEEQRAWVTQGLAQFAELLRKNNDNLEELSYNIIHYLVNYMKINQGGFFLLNQPETGEEGEKYFEMTACVAYDRRKFADKIIKWGEGLVGRCALEKETIYMTDVPDGYVNITSGLGEATPGAILIVPLKANEEIYGVIELASFRPFQQFEIEFVEKLGESIAVTISTVKTNIKTSKLLKETQIQAEKMAQQEEELRQNLEEMTATQEESERREIEMQGILDAIDHAAISCEFETDGTLISVNHNFLNTFKYRPEEIEGQNLKIFFFKEDEPELDKILSQLQKGQNFRGRVRRRTKLGEEIYLLTTYSPVVDNDGNIMKILSLENDVTEQVKMEEALKRSKEELGIMLEEARNEVKEHFKEIEAVKIRNEKTLEGALDAIITTNKDGILEFFNAAAEKLWGYSREEVLGKHVSKLFSKNTAKNDPFVSAFVNPGENKIIGQRKEVPILNKYGEEVPVLFLLSEAQVGDDHSYTAFIQNVEVELF
ncbi:PAS domain S-box protein [Thermophagus xiamenensis]|uniref:PAS domain S-box-containing protein n=1 Tax=Thermophagus xiamenensis TaxID=385682 RepID=A0A1I1ZC46_9BACT|nr:PAS domain S-box protein [Thermophagus xiamenensis]SFE29306.1 PAS domain S-box-containing protein [Thermophagus xiamenensis]